MDAKEKAALFNEYFISQCKVENNNAPVPILNKFQSSKIISHLSTTENEVKDLLSTVDVSKGCGVDGVANFLIKTCAVGIANSFSCFINISFSNGKFPLSWKLANVIPIFKKDNRQSKDNYRPVSLLSYLSKVAEKIVFIGYIIFCLRFIS